MPQAAVADMCHVARLDAGPVMTDNFPTACDREMDDDVQKTIDRLNREVAELLAARRRLVLAADADRRSIERELHEGVSRT